MKNAIEVRRFDIHYYDILKQQYRYQLCRSVGELTILVFLNIVTKWIFKNIRINIIETKY